MPARPSARQCTVTRAIAGVGVAATLTLAVPAAAFAADWSTSDDTARLYPGGSATVDVLSNDLLPGDAYLVALDTPAGLTAYVDQGQVTVLSDLTTAPGVYDVTYYAYSDVEYLGADGAAGILRVTVAAPLSVDTVALPRISAVNVSALRPVTTSPVTANLDLASVSVEQQPTAGVLTVNDDDTVTWTLPGDLTDADLDALRGRSLGGSIRVTAIDGQSTVVPLSASVQDWRPIAVSLEVTGGDGEPVAGVDLTLSGEADVDGSVADRSASATGTDGSLFALVRQGIYTVDVQAPEGYEIADVETAEAGAEVISSTSVTLDLRGLESAEGGALSVAVSLAPAPVPEIEQPAVSAPVRTNSPARDVEQDRSVDGDGVSIPERIESGSYGTPLPSRLLAGLSTLAAAVAIPVGLIRRRTVLR